MAGDEGPSPDEERTTDMTKKNEQRPKCVGCGWDTNANGNCFNDNCWNANSKRHNGIGR
jgi:hypothetical protein